MFKPENKTADFKCYTRVLEESICENKLRQINHFCFVAGFAVLISMLFQISAIAQQVENVDEAFVQARKLASEEKYEEARNLARAILEISPDYHDVRILLARTYSWNGDYQEAREELNIILQKSPEYRDALNAAIDNELWAENYDRALEITERALDYYPLNEAFLIKRARVQRDAGKPREALRTLDEVYIINPSNSAAKNLRESIQVSGTKYIMTGSYTYEWFTDVFDPWSKGYIQLSRKTSLGSVIGRLNYANRFESAGIQPEIDFYPSIMDGLYGYVNVGYSNAAVYPEFRLGGELYKRLPQGFEISAGFRHLRFESSNLTIYTGSLSKYQGSWYFAARPFFTPSDVGVSRSLNLLVRRYFGGPENYLTLRGGFGFSPHERRFQNISESVFLVKSQYIGVDIFKPLRDNLALFASFDGSRQELSFDPGTYIRTYSLNGGIQVKF